MDWLDPDPGRPRLGNQQMEGALRPGFPLGQDLAIVAANARPDRQRLEPRPGKREQAADRLARDHTLIGLFGRFPFEPQSLNGTLLSSHRLTHGLSSHFVPFRSKRASGLPDVRSASVTTSRSSSQRWISRMPPAFCLLGGVRGAGASRSRFGAAVGVLALSAAASALGSVAESALPA